MNDVVCGYKAAALTTDEEVRHRHACKRKQIDGKHGHHNMCYEQETSLMKANVCKFAQ